MPNGPQVSNPKILLLALDFAQSQTLHVIKLHTCNELHHLWGFINGKSKMLIVNQWTTLHSPPFLIMHVKIFPSHIFFFMIWNLIVESWTLFSITCWLLSKRKTGYNWSSSFYQKFFFLKKKDTLIKNPKKKDTGLRLCNIFLANVKWLVLLNRMVAKMSIVHESKFYVHIESMIQIRKIKNFIVGTARDSTILLQAM